MRRQVLFATALLFACSARAEDWPVWRGPHHDCISRETDWINDWDSAGPPVAWRANVGTGLSSVSIAAGKLFTAGHRDGQDTIYCLEAQTGKLLWQHAYPAPLVDNLHEGGPAATPTVDGRHVYTLSKDGQLFCLAVDTGAIVWQQNIGTLADVAMPEWGFSCSPLVVGEKLIVDAGATLALDKHSGKLLWKTAKYLPGYGSPAPCTFDGALCVAVLNNDALIVVRCDDGALVASHPWSTDYLTSSTTPIVAGDTVFISTGYGRGCALLRRADQRFDVVYKNRNMANHMATCILWNDHLYGFDGNSHNARIVKLSCLDYATGEIRWSHRGLGCGSLAAAADGRLIVLSDDGQLVIVAADPAEYRELAWARVLEGRCWTVPVLAHGRIYCRNATGDLVCVDVRPGAAR
ncbi:MAG TPA: PQQ-binding-like beta-propeller repeat protein [Pirellulales bacterium]|jgi:outer membrane protein assembly factor BamB|nr:PQQ-binding-like beta-propeller repeat protein [Pirellulales bacterium]